MKRLAAAVAMTAGLATGVAGADDGALRGGLAALSPWLGTWQIEATWSSGETLWAQSEYRPLLGGAFLEGRAFVREGGGELYQRYRTVLAWRDAGVELHVFNHDGTVVTSVMAVDGPVTTSSWTMGDTVVDERLELAGDGATMRWQVWSTPAGGERSLLMDGTWRRVDAEPIALAAPATLAGPVADLAPLLGGWEVASAWDDGTPLWARGEYRPGLGGRFVDNSTWTTGADGGWYHRYETVFADRGDGALEAVSFGFDGSLSRAAVTGTLGEGLQLERETVGSGGLRQQLSLEPDGALRWQVWSRTGPDGEWREAMDGRWRRQGALEGRREPVDPGRFAAAGEDLRSFVKEAVIAVPPAAVWAAWTDAEAWGRLWGPPSRGRFDLAIGGAYEWLFDGVIGGNGAQILAYVPGRLLAFSWNAPPSQPANRLQRTWVVVELEPTGDAATRVRLTHLGFGDGPEWDETYAYFDSAWGRVLELMAASLVPQETAATP